METITLKQTIDFIAVYHQLETSNDSLAFGVITHVVTNIYEAKDICKLWENRKKNFGNFFENVSQSNQFKLLEFWGLPELHTDHYYDKGASPEAGLNLFLYGEGKESTGYHSWAQELLKYFSKNRICDSTRLELPKAPDKDNAYGDSFNWAMYLLSLKPQEQNFVLIQIYKYYQSLSL